MGGNAINLGYIMPAKALPIEGMSIETIQLINGILN